MANTSNKGGRGRKRKSRGQSNRGFAAMDEETQREIASKGGQASGGNFKYDPQRASEAGRKGGSQ